MLKFVSNVRQIFAADDFSRYHFSDAFFLGALRVKHKHDNGQSSESFPVCRNLLKRILTMGEISSQSSLSRRCFSLPGLAALPG